MEKDDEKTAAEWERDFQWLRIRHFVKEQFGKDKLPDLNAVLFLVGIQELGRWRKTYTKEEKQDLMHIALCRLFAFDGYYEFVGRDEDGWPHYNLVRQLPKHSLSDQEEWLKDYVIRYFSELELEIGDLDSHLSPNGA